MNSPEKQAYLKAYYVKNRDRVNACNRRYYYKLSPDKKAAYNKRRRDAAVRNRAWLRNQKLGRPCADCKQVFPPECMDFDHVYGVKCFAVSMRSACVSRKLAAEIAKCELVCCNCHRIRTYKRHYESITEEV